MPSFDIYKKMNGSFRTDGEVRKQIADEIIENTWDESIESKIAYIYDYYLDDEPLKYRNLNSTKSKTKIPVEVKFIVNSHNSDSKDQVSYKIQFKPSFRWEELKSLRFYKERFEDKYFAEYPLGLWCDLPDEKGNYRKWLFTTEADWLDNQFPSWYILPCDHILQWVTDGIKYQHCAVTRSQNSYNSGVWQSRGGAVQTTTPENQKIIWLPMNELTSTITYDQRIVVSSVVKVPIVWSVSKVDNTNPNGITHYTLAQDRWNEHTDAFEYEHEDGKEDFSPIFDSKRKVIGMYADYYVSNITPTEPEIETPIKIYGKIFYNAQPELRVGGSYKKFTIKFFDGEEEIKLLPGDWSFTMNGQDCSALLTTIKQDGLIKVKFNGDSDYIGSVITIKYITTDMKIDTSINVEVIGL